MKRRLATFALAVALAACSSSPEKPKPKPLEPIASPIAGRLVWNHRIEAVNFPLTVAVSRSGVVAVGSGDGTVVALQADDGRQLWRTGVDAKLSAGVGSDGRFAAVVTRDNELVVIDGGQVAWRKPLGVRVTTAPLVAGERVFVLGLDRTVQAFDALDGRRLWILRRPGDPLALAHAGVLTAFKDTLIVGQGPRLAGVDPLRGMVRWEVPVASPRGTNEVERLADLVAPPARVGDVLCARAFQAAVGCVNAERATLQWARNLGGTDGVAADEQIVVAADASDRITAWRTANGEIAWTQEALMYRELGAPLLVGPTVVFGDAEGTLHWLSRDKGEAVLRMPTDGSPIVAGPVRAGSTVIAVTRNGGVYAFRSE